MLERVRARWAMRREGRLGVAYVRSVEDEAWRFRKEKKEAQDDLYAAEKRIERQAERLGELGPEVERLKAVVDESEANEIQLRQRLASCEASISEWDQVNRSYRISLDQAEADFEKIAKVAEKHKRSKQATNASVF